MEQKIMLVQVGRPEVVGTSIRGGHTFLEAIANTVNSARRTGIGQMLIYAADGEEEEVETKIADILSSLELEDEKLDFDIVVVRNEKHFPNTYRVNVASFLKEDAK